jgi:acyl carrier protein
LSLQALLGPLFPELKRPLRADDSPATLEGWDSMRQVEIILTVEEAFDVTLATADIAGLRSVHALVDILRGKGRVVEL